MEWFYIILIIGLIIGKIIFWSIWFHLKKKGNKNVKIKKEK